MTPRLGFRRVRAKARAHPLVRLLIEKMNEQGVGVVEMCAEAGIARNTFGFWGRSQSPTVQTLEACFTVLGYKLTVEKVDAYVRRRVVVMVAPDGVSHQTDNVANFCELNGLKRETVSKMLNGRGRVKSHRGWTAHYDTA